jgi:hypothetical protein
MSNQFIRSIKKLPQPILLVGFALLTLLPFWAMLVLALPLDGVLALAVAAAVELLLTERLLIWRSA